MKRIATVITVMILAAASATAQNIVAPVVDTTAILEVRVDNRVVDPEYVGKDIFALLATKETGKGKVTLHQSDALRLAMNRHIARNSDRKINGYRVRIFFDNSQTARGRSASVAASFRARYPGIRAYENYTNPYFKVTVGDFRTQAEAQEFADQITGIYHSAFVVRETINYPLR